MEFEIGLSAWHGLLGWVGKGGCKRRVRVVGDISGEQGSRHSADINIRPLATLVLECVFRLASIARHCLQQCKTGLSVKITLGSHAVLAKFLMLDYAEVGQQCMPTLQSQLAASAMLQTVDHVCT